MNLLPFFVLFHSLHHRVNGWAMWARSFIQYSLSVAKRQIDDSVFSCSCSCCVLNRTYQNVNITRRTQPRKYTSIYYKVVTCCVSVLQTLYHLGRFGFSPQSLNRYSNEPFFKCRHLKSLSLSLCPCFREHIQHKAFSLMNEQEQTAQHHPTACNTERKERKKIDATWFLKHASHSKIMYVVPVNIVFTREQCETAVTEWKMRREQNKNVKH